MGINSNCSTPDPSLRATPEAYLNVKLSYQDLGQGIYCIDTFYYRPKLAGCYLIVRGSEAAIIDTGTARSAHCVLQLLEEKLILPEQVKYVIPTHIHLDHAGGSGELMSQLPEAQLIVHPRGAPHMIEPEKIIQGTIAVYGEQAFKDLYGEIKPVAEQRVTEATDGLTLELDGHQLSCLHTPGHAKHHICIWDEYSSGFFTGDTFGIAYSELSTSKGDFIFLPSTPIDFDPEGWHKTLDKLMGYQPKGTYLTHYGQLNSPAPHAETLHQRLNDYRDIALGAHSDDRAAEITSKLTDYYLQALKSHSCSLSSEAVIDILGMDIALCAQGLDIWLKRCEKNQDEHS